MRPDTIVEVRRFRNLLHCSCVLLLGLPALAAAQPQPASNQATGYLVFLRGTPVGRELVIFTRDQKQISITAQGRMLAPLNITIRAAEFRYQPDWTPSAFKLEKMA